MEDFDFEKYMQDLVDLFVTMERSLRDYYSVCLQKLPQHDESWKKLIAQEEKHAQMFEAIKECLKKNVDSWKRGKFRPQALQIVINDVQARKREFEEGKIAPKYALTFISDVENSMLESSLKDAFTCVDPQVQAELSKIQHETKEHRKLLQDIIKEHFK